MTRKPTGHLEFVIAIMCPTASYRHSLVSFAVYLKSVMPVMMAYTPSQRLPRYNLVAAFSSWFSSICAFTISRVPRANSVPTLCSEHFLFYSLLGFMLGTTPLLLRPMYNVAQILFSAFRFFHGIFCFSTPRSHSHLFRDAVCQACPKIVFFAPWPHP